MTPLRLVAALVAAGFAAAVWFQSWPATMVFLGALSFAATVLYLELGVSKYTAELKTLREDLERTRARTDVLDRVLNDKDSGAVEQIRRLRIRAGMETK